MSKARYIAKQILKETKFNGCVDNYSKYDRAFISAQRYINDINDDFMDITYQIQKLLGLR